MRISVFGMGYVGAVSAACLAREGHTVIGVDPNPTKVDLINGGQSPIIEQELGELIAQAVKTDRLKAVSDAAQAVNATEISLICVGTPSQPNGSLDLSFIKRVCEEIGPALAAKRDFHVVVIRSTVLPGTIRDLVIPTLETTSGKRCGEDFGVASNPEFLREGSAVADFYSPPKTVIGESDARSGDLLAALYAGIDAPMLRMAIETAEMIKYADNAWHAVKVGFANEIGSLCKAVGIDGQKVMEAFCQDRKLNLSPYYLKPGFAFGGSCLPKDVRALNYKARSLDVELPLLSSVLPSNQQQIERGIRMVMEKENRKIGILGLSFKAGTDDLRESPIVELVERLLGKGYDIRIYDRNVKLASLVGANKDYILNKIPHISKLLVEHLDDVIEHAETIVIGNGDNEFHQVLDRIRDHQSVVDLVRIGEDRSNGHYDGICW